MNEETNTKVLLLTLNELIINLGAGNPEEKQYAYDALRSLSNLTSNIKGGNISRVFRLLSSIIEIANERAAVPIKTGIEVESSNI